MSFKTLFCPGYTYYGIGIKYGPGPNIKNSKAMKKQDVLYENKWCRIISKDTFYVLQSKSNKYNDQYFQTADQAQKAVGINSWKGYISIFS